MSKRADVLQSIWADPWFLALDSDAKLLYLWALTTSHGNQAGLFVVGEVVMQLETAMTPERLSAALARLEGKVVYDRDTGTLWVRGKAKHIRMKTTQIAKSVASAIKSCPSPQIRAAFLDKYGDESWLKPEIVNLTRGSREVQANPLPEPKTVNLTRTSPEVPSQGLGQGHSQLREARQIVGAGPAAERARLIPQLIEILNRLESDAPPLTGLDEMALMSAMDAHPDADPIKAAHSAVARGRKNVNRVTALLMELRTLDAYGAKARESEPKPAVQNAQPKRDKCADCGAEVDQRNVGAGVGRCDPCAKRFSPDLFDDEELAA